MVGTHLMTLNFRTNFMKKKGTRGYYVKKSKMSNNWKQEKINLFICAVYFFCLGFTIGGEVVRDYEEKQQSQEVKKIQVEIIEESTTKKESTTTEETTKEPTLRSLGTFKITSYCSCSECCGYWAYNRPLDENGNEIVLTASGETAEAGKTVAVDPNVIPFGTELLIDGHKYIAQDTGSAVKGNVIDVYYSDHEQALIHEMHYTEVFIIN